jgi:hypothetical protein
VNNPLHSAGGSCPCSAAFSQPLDSPRAALRQPLRSLPVPPERHTFLPCRSVFAYRESCGPRSACDREYAGEIAVWHSRHSTINRIQTIHRIAMHLLSTRLRRRCILHVPTPLSTASTASTARPARPTCPTAPTLAAHPPADARARLGDPRDRAPCADRGESAAGAAQSATQALPASHVH